MYEVIFENYGLSAIKVLDKNTFFLAIILGIIKIYLNSPAKISHSVVDGILASIDIASRKRSV